MMIQIRHKATGAVLLEVDAATLVGAKLSGAKLQGASLQGVDLRGAIVNNADLRDVDLRGANLTNATFNGTALDSANAAHSIFVGADLTDCTLVGADFTEANMQKVNLRYAKLTGANLSGANLTKSDMSMTDLRANLSSANLEGADLRAADLTGANLMGANLERANLTSANLNCAVITRARMGGASTRPAATRCGTARRFASGGWLQDDGQAGSPGGNSGKSPSFSARDGCRSTGRSTFAGQSIRTDRCHELRAALAAWRIGYITGDKSPSAAARSPAGLGAGSGSELLSLPRSERENAPKRIGGITSSAGTSPAIVVLNRYPYNNGHLLVAPRRHVPGLADLTADEHVELMKSIVRLTACSKKR